MVSHSRAPSRAQQRGMYQGKTHANNFQSRCARRLQASSCDKNSSYAPQLEAAHRAVTSKINFQGIGRMYANVCCVVSWKTATRHRSEVQSVQRQEGLELLADSCRPSRSMLRKV